ncbi:MAG: C25 family cysteine peptidase [Chloroherpetonaceae bacterium]|nr:C25 family cysteine peptidase [Chloroherpetonaceae bacterium]
MEKMLIVSMIFVCLFFLFFDSLFSQSFKLRDETIHSFTLDVFTNDLKVYEVERGDYTISFSGSDFDHPHPFNDSSSSFYDIPVKHFFVAVPQNGKIDVRSKSYGRYEQQLSMLGSKQRPSKGNEKNASKNGSSPNLASVIRYQSIAGQRVAVIRVSPVHLSVESNSLIIHPIISITIHSQVSLKDAFQSHSENSSSEGDLNFLRSSVVNFHHIKKWNRIVEKEQNVSISKPFKRNLSSIKSNSFPDFSKPWLKLLITKNGIVSLEGRDLMAAGVDITLINPMSFKLYRKSIELPLHLSGEMDSVMNELDQIQFLGEVNKPFPYPIIDETTGKIRNMITPYYDEYSDTAVYWLTWGGAKGKRYSIETVTPSNGLVSEKQNRILRAEYDGFYHPGVNPYITERTFTEGWHWRAFIVQNTLSDDSDLFELPTEGALQTGNAKIRFRLIGISQDVNSSGEHRVECSIGNTVLGEFVFYNRADTIAEFTFPSNLLSIPSTQFRLTLKRNSTVQTLTNIVNLDAIEIEYESDYSFQKLPTFNLEARHQSFEGEGKDVVLSNRTGTGVSALNLTDSTWLDGVLLFENKARLFAKNKKTYLVAESEEIIKPILKKVIPEYLFLESNGAEYLIITAEELKTEALRLASLRSSKLGGNFSTKVVSVESIFDEYNFGVYSPESVKAFIKDAFDRWQIKPRFIVLFGGGNWDSKHRIPQSSLKKPLIPVYGNPVSDIWFVSFRNDSLRPFINLPQCTIGRIPAQSSLEAKAYLDKLEEHLKVLDGGAESWHKRFLFINGGFTRSEQLLFRQNSNFLADNFIRIRPIGGIVDTIYRDDQNPFINYQLSERLEESFNSGASVVNFIGHAGSQTWDLALNDPKALRNKGKYPIVMSWTCHTGRFAEPYNRTFGELFVLQPNSGSLIFLGTSGWGFPSTDYAMMRGAYRAVADSLLDVSSVWSGAYQELLNLTPFWEPLRVGTLDQYNILGDPAFRIPLKTKPDFFFPSNAVQFIRGNSPIRTLSERDTARLIIVVGNNGLSPVNQRVRLKIYDQIGFTTKVLLQDTLILSPKVNDTIRSQFQFNGQSGEHQLTATINELQEVDEFDVRNNEVLLRFTVVAENQILVSPQDYSVISPMNPELSVVTEGNQVSHQKLRFELDTSSSFSSAVLEVSPDIEMDPFITKWKPQSTLLVNRPYYWRVGKVINNAVQEWKTSVITFGNQTTNNQVWRLNGSLFSRLRLSNTEVQNGSIRLSNGSYPIRLRSVGSRGGLFNIRYEITIGEVSSFAAYGANRRGLNVVVIDTAIGLTPLVNRNYDLWEIQNNDPQASIALLKLTEMLENLKPHQIVFVALMDAIPPVDYPPISGLIELFKSLGSRRYAQLKVGESWVFAGSMNKSFYLEDWGSRCSSTNDSGCDSLFRSARAEGILRLPNREGTFESDIIGKASQWLDLRVEQSSNGGSSINTSVYGVNSNQTEDSLFTLNESKNVLQLTNLNAKRYAFIRLRGTLTRGSDSQNPSPTLNTITVRYKGTPDVAVSSEAMSFSDSTLEEGKPNNLTLELRNLGSVVVDSIPITIVQQELERSRSDSAIRMMVRNLKPNESRQFNALLNTRNKRGRIQVSVSIDENETLNELTKLNNSAEKSYTVLSDTIAPEVRVTIDGREIRDGDLVSAKPTIQYQITDRSPIPISDTSLYQLRLNGRRIFFNNPSVTFSAASSQSQSSSVTFTPFLESGTYTLQATIRDASGNLADSTSSSIRFTVQNDFSIEGFYNYPNPFANQTQFAFRLTGDGSEIIEEMKLRIFTVSGRMVKELNLLNAIQPIGIFSLISWDGRDEDGDLLSNGTYIYRLSVVTNRQSISKTEKLSILR